MPAALPLRPLFITGILMASLMLAAWGWIEQRWATAGFYLVVLLLTAIFVAPPLWTYTRPEPKSESPEEEDSPDDELFSQRENAYFD